MRLVENRSLVLGQIGNYRRDTVLGATLGNELRLDAGQLVELGGNLRTVATAFDGAQDNADYIAGAVGHEGLADKVRHFANGWDDRRAKMLDSIAGLADACTQCGDSFQDIEDELLSALLGEK